MGDAVNSPNHYANQGTIECIDYIESFLTREEYIGYLRGNIAKYLHRWRYKNQLEDVEKAQWYLARLKEFMNEEDTVKPYTELGVANVTRSGVRRQGS